MSRLGFERRAPAGWNRWWLCMWLIATPIVIVSAFHVSFWWWLLLALVGLLLPEMISISKKEDRFPPLTHAFRHFVPNWVAFPVIYFAVGSVGANWLGFGHPLRIGGLLGLLGWLTDHFTVTYAQPDPYPYSAPPEPPPVGKGARVPS